MSVGIIHMNRGTGKTVMLLEKMIDEPRAVMVTASHRRSRFAIDAMVEMIEKRTGKRVGKIQRQGLEHRFIPITRWQEEARGRVAPGTPIYIDDVDDVLVTLLGNVETCTTSTTVTHQRPVHTEEQS